MNKLEEDEKLENRGDEKEKERSMLRNEEKNDKDGEE